MKELEETIEFAKDISKIIIESGEEHQPIMFIFTPTGTHVTQLVNVDKNLFKPAISMLLRQFHAYAYVFINEAWGAKLSKDSPLLPKLLSGEILVSDLPPDDKEEILTIMVAENEKSYHGYSAKIKYTSEGKRYLGEWGEMKGIATGRLILKEW